MKKTILITALATTGLVALPAYAEKGVEKQTTEQAATATVPVYIVQTSGKGWGLTSRVGSALKSQEGVAKVLLSGLRGTVIMKEGATLDEAKVKASLQAAGLGLASFSEDTLPMPSSTFMLQVSGIGWSETNDKARAALEKVVGISGAYIDNGIVLHYTDNTKFDQAKVDAVLSKFKIKIKSSAALEANPFS